MTCAEKAPSCDRHDPRYSTCHLRSPWESSTSDAEEGTSSMLPKPAKRVRSSGLTSIRPPNLELTDDEDKSNLSLSAQVGSLPPGHMRKLRRTETLIEAELSSSDDSMMATENGGMSSEDEESDDLVQLTQNVRLSQKMAIEDSIIQHCTVSDHKSSTSVHSKAQQAAPPAPRTIIKWQLLTLRAVKQSTKTSRLFGKHVQSEDHRGKPGHLAGHQVTQTLSNGPQVPESEFTVPTSNANSNTLEIRGPSSDTAQSSIANPYILHSKIILENAFPDALLTTTFVWQALITATSCLPSATEIHNRVLIDHDYFLKISILPRVRISIFRAEIKEQCVAAVMLAVDTQSSPAVIASIIKNQLNDFNYIFPRQTKGYILIGSPLRSRPYRSSVILSVIRDKFFSGADSFVAKHQDSFPSHLGKDGEAIPEVLKVMLALVSTANSTMQHFMSGAQVNRNQYISQQICIWTPTAAT
ncbi:hypothetical protein EI94DRAFT_1706971 [Lactarius quietus]|nr:hypothetical protein EI94DRAFT_1706971 [Lactarius quietus]